MKVQSKIIVGLGELLWDLLPSGKKIGGAPANFAYHAASLGNQGLIVSQIGDDSLGQEIISDLQKIHLNTSYINIDPAHPTGTVQVEIDAHGQPSYTIIQNVAWDYLEWTDSLEHLATKTDAVCFGTLAQRTPTAHETIQGFLKKTISGSTIRVFDVNLRQHYYSDSLIGECARVADIIKLNQDELPIVAQLLGLKIYADLKDQSREMLDRYGLKLICVTRGAEGSLMVTPAECDEHTGFPVQMADPVGAGDAFTAAMVHHYLRGSNLEQINVAANRLGSWVAGEVGATPSLPRDVVDLVLGGM